MELGADDWVLLGAYVVIYGAAELAYLTLAGPMYKAHFRTVQGSDPSYKLGVAALAYAVLFTVVYRFVVRPVYTAVAMPRLRDVLTNATLLALAIYGMYNLTNLATLARYSVRVAVQDTLWGVVALNGVALACYLLKAWSLKNAHE